MSDERLDRIEAELQELRSKTTDMSASIFALIQFLIISKTKTEEFTSKRFEIMAGDFESGTRQKSVKLQNVFNNLKEIGGASFPALCREIAANLRRQNQ